MKISVIVPVFNAELYVKDCILSILGQTYTEFELILVDDGSTDQSGKICDNFASKDARIKVISKKNKGALHARITGLEAAKGEYAAFVDADDWIESRFLERLISCMEETKADIVVSGCTSENEDFRTQELNQISAGIYENEKLANDFIPRMLHYQGFYQFGVFPYMCNKLFRRKILKRFCKNIDIRIYDGEDAAIVYPYLLFANKVVVIEDCMYHYRLHRDSVSFQKGSGFYENVSRLYLHLNKMFRMSKYYEVMLPQLDQYMRRMVWLGTPEKIREKGQYCFPFGKVPQGANIVLYGAGGVGITYYQQIRKTEYCNIVLWVDKNYINLWNHGLAISAPEAIIGENYDFVVIANGREEIQEEMSAYLVNLGISEKRIILSQVENL